MAKVQFFHTDYTPLGTFFVRTATQDTLAVVAQTTAGDWYALFTSTATGNGSFSIPGIESREGAEAVAVAMLTVHYGQTKCECRDIRHVATR